jgi:nucleoside phosphorylase
MKMSKSDRDFARHIIEFDRSDERTHAVWTVAQPLVMMRQSMGGIPWPAGLAPIPKKITPKPSKSAPLPKADVLVVTWTVAEGDALGDVLTPGFECKTDWYQYRHLYDSKYKKNIRNGAPASQSKILGKYFLTKIGSKKVLCFKSELHLSQDGVKLPVKDLWRQIIDETGASLVITTGTAGGIGSTEELGDVIVGRSVRFDCGREFKNSPFNNKIYTNSASVPKKYFRKAKTKLLMVNSDRFRSDNKPPAIITNSKHPVKTAVVTTDFFGFDNSTNTYGLKNLGAAVEMGDAVLGLVAQEMGGQAPVWFAIRNASDPQMDGNLPLKEQKKKAAQIYEKYGYWTSVESAIVTWAVIAGK